jgi:hypothetical protein
VRVQRVQHWQPPVCLGNGVRSREEVELPRQKVGVRFRLLRFSRVNAARSRFARQSVSPTAFSRRLVDSALKRCSHSLSESGFSRSVPPPPSLGRSVNAFTNPHSQKTKRTAPA